MKVLGIHDVELQVSKTRDKNSDELRLLQFQLMPCSH